jgi:hypothetical protein
MPIEFTYTPPAVNGVLAMHLAKEAAEMAGAEFLLAAARPLVPRDTGEMAESGKVDHGPAGAEVSFTRTGPDGYNVAVRQHEDETLHHPNGGEAHFLSKPMAVEAGAIVAGMGAVVRELT